MCVCVCIENKANQGIQMKHNHQPQEYKERFML